jgi:minor histocompatibility antigen H13
MAENATAFDAIDITLTDANATGNNVTVTPGGALAGIFDDASFFLLELQLVLSAIGIIYISSHAALRRPPSASVPGAGTKEERKKKDDEENFTQGLMPSDAIMFPILAGAMLVGLYYLIQWLQDPAILNTILRYYMSTMSIASLLTLYAHSTELVLSFLFPRFWRGRDGLLRKVDQEHKAILICDDVGNTMDGSTAESNPCPGLPAFLSRPGKIQEAVWEIRRLLTQNWTIRFYIRGAVKVKLPFRLSHVMALFLSVATAVVYFSTNSTFLSNMLGYGMCYGSLLIISPTDFLTSSLVLSGLFLYDIVMVFYT